MITTYKLNTNELSTQLIKLIKKSFPGKEVEITVFEQDATDYLKSNPSNEKHLNEAIDRIEKGKELVTVKFPAKKK